MTFDPTSPQVLDTEVIPTCTPGGTDIRFTTYDQDGIKRSSALTCDGAYTFTDNLEETITVVECDITLAEDSCEDTTLTDARTDLGYVSDEPYTFITPEETCEDGIQNQDETTIDGGGICNVITLLSPTTDYIVQVAFILLTFIFAFLGTIYIIRKTL